ncbi:helix-turn-helix transcriptional regulator [Labedaea rhizosphaerae]|uniref:AraC family transcriptional regulator n=1 Tax=Labedaea rhizosphaerae TaxID=598644 RepID=A0A4R6RUM2_LABRH|nr:helix-turn-helix transcriptional regulator [Labedaea rhizosphaerae]TDP90610.1 AraC family transcriptional regulator [Labedaea rhizosphaerae]
MRDAVQEAARFIVARSEEALTLADVADHVAYSPFHLARAFEREIGLPPGKFLAAQRFQVAKRLLLDTDDKIADVCNAVGFHAPGTFTTRFTAAVGVSPQRFRRLPSVLADNPPLPVSVPGPAADGGTVSGRVLLGLAALAAVGGQPAVYVGLFPRRAASGIPVSGALLGPDARFTLTGVPPGSYRLMACALAAAESPRTQLVARAPVVGAAARPVHVRRGPLQAPDLWLDVPPPWSPPVLVALPPLACRTAQDRTAQDWRCPAIGAPVGLAVGGLAVGAEST